METKLLNYSLDFTDQYFDDVIQNLNKLPTSQRIGTMQQILKRCAEDFTYVTRICERYSSDYSFTPFTGQNIILNSKLLHDQICAGKFDIIQKLKNSTAYDIVKATEVDVKNADPLTCIIQIKYQGGKKSQLQQNAFSNTITRPKTAIKSIGKSVNLSLSGISQQATLPSNAGNQTPSYTLNRMQATKIHTESKQQKTKPVFEKP